MDEPGGFDYALYATGNVSLLGVPGVTLSGTSGPSSQAPTTTLT